MNVVLRGFGVTIALGGVLSVQAAPILEPKIQSSAAYSQKFPPPYGYGIHMEYSIIDAPSYVRLKSVTTQYSPDGGKTWLTDEPARVPTLTWDNIIGNVVCGPDQHNLESDHLYALRAILHWSYEDDVPRQTISNVVTARVASYLCNEVDDDQDGIPDDLELALAKKYFPDAWGVDLVADLQTFYGYAADPLLMRHGTIPFVVRPLLSSNGRCQEHLQCLEILYGMAFSRDCGAGSPHDSCSGTHNHLGDSESYAVLVARAATTDPTVWGVDWEAAKGDPNVWYLVADRTTAHEGTFMDFTAYGWYGRWALAPKIYIAHGKHGGYHTVRACTENGPPLFKDECAEHLRLRAYVDLARLQNVGNPENHSAFDTTIGRPTPDYLWEVDVEHPYDVWSGQDFAPDVSPYAPKLGADLQWTTVAACLFDRIGVRDRCCKGVELAPGKAYEHCSKGCLKLECPFFDPNR